MPAKPTLIPLWVKLAYTAFMAVLLPIYLKNYGASNFLYFCDVAAIMTLVAIWLESPLLLSAALVGIFLPQMLWVADFLVEVAGRLLGRGWHLTSMTKYMFDPPYFLRFLSFFHFWLPFLLMWLVYRVGYDRRGVLLWSGMMWVLLTVCYAWMPPTSPKIDSVTKEQLRDPNKPVNINYVYNIQSDDEPQQWMDPDLYFAAYLAVLLAIYAVTHALFLATLPHRTPIAPPKNIADPPLAA
ncbi:MAG: hypothetical protein HY289_07820 [Planctomycetes bacterium]|nr:hypothetical protein [Planctomycetota bacterium]